MKLYSVLYINQDEPGNSEILSVHHNKNSAVAALIKHAHYEDRDGKLLQYKNVTKDYIDYKTLWDKVYSTNTLNDYDMYRIEELQTKQQVSCKLQGGLGTQLFQIFTTIAYAIETDKEYVFENNITIGNKKQTYWDKFLKNIYYSCVCDNNDSFLKTFPIIGEKQFDFNELPSINSNIMLNGYFQSYKYFIKHIDKIFKIIKLENIKDKVYLKYKSKYFHEDDNDNNYVSMHFRFGERLKLGDYYLNLPCSYYENVLKNISNNSHVLYFYEKESQDLVDEYITRLKLLYPNLTFISVDPEIEDWEHMLLMSLCDDNIIANSSFSYFGAVFNDYENKNVYYPSKWFGECLKHHDTKDLCFDNWTKIDVGYHSPTEVLNFWFGFNKWENSSNSIFDYKDKLPIWFGIDSNMKPISSTERSYVDNICKRFAYLIDIVNHENSMTDEWDKDCNGLYAKMLLTDQLSRNCFRGTSKAFKYDNVAVRFALEIIDNKMYTNFGLVQFIFLSTTLQHSENMNDHIKMEELLNYLENKFGIENECFIQIKQACDEHKNVIEQFGRYPHRNKILDRESTDQEITWLQRDDLPNWVKSQY